MKCVMENLRINFIIESISFQVIKKAIFYWVNIGKEIY